jgi:adenylosuccinate lyase
MRAWKEDLIFREEVARDAEIAALLSEEQLQKTFDMTRQLGNVDAIFARVLDKEAEA